VSVLFIPLLYSYVSFDFTTEMNGQDRHNQVKHMNTTEMNGQDRHNQVKHMNTTEMNGQDTIK
jgi:hypothetical protein